MALGGGAGGHGEEERTIGEFIYCIASICLVCVYFSLILFFSVYSSVLNPPLLC